MRGSDRNAGGVAAAEALALGGLGWLAADPERLDALMGAAGLAPADLAARAAEPEFLGFVLDFILADEARARDFAEESGLGPEDATRARMALPGGDVAHWT
ncbi:DUF3572 family protein [Rubrimonas cliftonensis]|uniref:DUF3572 domain-containing protein n=1 Tax=Rubrimonas cliftonensis TaxID=89524 RepID=A0A1H4BZR1_9RHOB|nr:DUF3572 family protein [Rubrimonas cliftonensis]SEA53560.1 Protein of unknown function [Rubrimonas cliftonensis]